MGVSTRTRNSGRKTAAKIGTRKEQTELVPLLAAPEAVIKGKQRGFGAAYEAEEGDLVVKLELTKEALQLLLLGVVAEISSYEVTAAGEIKGGKIKTRIAEDMSQGKSAVASAVEWKNNRFLKLGKVRNLLQDTLKDSFDMTSQEVREVIQSQRIAK